MSLPVGPSGALPSREGVQECGRPDMGIPCRGGGVGVQIKVGGWEVENRTVVIHLADFLPRSAPYYWDITARLGVPRYRIAIVQSCPAPRSKGLSCLGIISGGH